MTVRRTVIFLCLLPFPAGQEGRQQPEHRGHQQDAHRQRTGNARRLQTLPQRLEHLPLQAQTHGVIHARAGQQREDGDDQIRRHRAAAHPGHHLGIQGGENGGVQVHGVYVHAQRLTQQIDHPGGRAADDAQHHPLAVDVEQDGKAVAPHEHRQGLGPGGPHQRRRLHHGAEAVDRLRHPPGRRRAQRDGEGRQKDLHDAHHAGVGVAVDDVPHGVGDQQSRHQDHQRADNGRVRVIQPPQPRRDVGGHRHQERGDDGTEKGVGLHPVHEPVDAADDQPHQPRPQAVPQRAAEHQCEAQSPQKAAQIGDGGAVHPALGHGLPQPLRSHLHLRLFPADAAAEGVQLLQRLQIVAVVADALQDGQGLAVGRLKADSQAVGDGEHLALHAIGAQDAADGVLHPEGLGPGQGQLAAQPGRQIGQKIVIHHGTLPRLGKMGIAECKGAPRLLHILILLPLAKQKRQPHAEGADLRRHTGPPDAVQLPYHGQQQHGGQLEHEGAQEGDDG